MTNKTKGRITGLGGIFFKTKDPAKTRAWYAENLGIETDEYGVVFESRKSDTPDEKAYMVWSPFPDSTDYFDPANKEFMINYRVENIEALVEELKEKGVQVLDDIETYEYGKFVHIMDAEGNKIEFWEPIDSEFTKLYEGKTVK